MVQLSHWTRGALVWAGLGLAACFSGFEPGSMPKRPPDPTATPNVGIERGTPKQSYEHSWNKLCVAMHSSGMFDGKEDTVTEKLSNMLISWIDKNVVDQRVRAFLVRAFKATPDQRATLLANELKRLGIRQCNFVTYTLLIDCGSERQSPYACYQLGMSALRNKKQAKARRLFTRALKLFNQRCTANGGEPCVLVGLMHKLGQGTAANDAEATRFFRRACQTGDARGCKALRRSGNPERAK